MKDTEENIEHESPTAAEPVQQPEELEIVSDVTEKIVTEPEHTDDR